MDLFVDLPEASVYIGSVLLTPSNDTPAEESGFRLVRVIDRLNIGGPTYHVCLLARDLTEHGYQTLLVKGRVAPGEAEMADVIHSSGVTPLQIDGLSKAVSVVDDLRAFLDLFRLFRRFRPHVVHTHKPKAGVLGRLAAWLAGVPVTVHTFHGHLLRGYFPLWVSNLILVLERLLAHRTDAIVGVSRKTRDDLYGFRLTRASRLHAIPLGLELEPFLRACRSDDFRSELGVPPDVPLVGFVGRLAPIKGLDLWLEAARLVIDSVPDARFVLVGDGVLREELEALSESLGLSDRVIFTGFRKDLVRIYASLDLVVLSSHNEGLPTMLIQAITVGCYVVATRVGGVPELVPDENVGLVVPPNNPRALARAMVRSIGERRCVPESHRRMSAQRYGIGRLSENLDVLYRMLLNRKLKWQTGSSCSVIRGERVAS